MTSRLRVEDFSLKDSLECGQFFRFVKNGEAYLIQASDQIFSIRQKGDLLYYEGVEESFLVHFFRLDEDRPSLLKEIDVDPLIRGAIKRYPGLRLIRQDPWECLVSFLLSSAKRIGHIRCLIESLCRACGEKGSYGSFVGYGFPDPERLRASLSLDEVRAGFRKAYLFKIGQTVERADLFRLKGLPYEEARQRLLGLAGVGKKIADCVLLYSLDFLQAFPIDTWIRKGLQRFYFKGREVGPRELEVFVREHFGPYAGYAQLFLYYDWRSRFRSD
ncbi:MAG: DNA-3-methyladenine glycosylase 2 family protein [Desulfobacterota bacterium]|nr:DNA-3-methyladenine glycosylase 2 family protein [Thermodesulfobacteriota bacterium]